MDLSTMENKLETGLYRSVQQFEADFQLMWDNCEEYNGDDSGKCTCTLEEVIRPQWSTKEAGQD